MTNPNTPVRHRRRKIRWAPLLMMGVIAVAVLVFAVIGAGSLVQRLAGNVLGDQLYPRKYTEYVEKYCREYEVEEALAYAVIRTESNFEPDAVSSIGARGLMQLTEDTFDWVAWQMEDESSVYDDMFDPETNIRYGVYLLSRLQEKFGATENVLCAYHAGWGITQKWLEDPQYAPDGKTVTNIPYDDTDYYVRKVVDTIQQYRSIYY